MSQKGLGRFVFFIFGLAGLAMGGVSQSLASELTLEIAPKSASPSSAQKLIWVLASHVDPGNSPHAERHSEKITLRLPSVLAPYFSGVELAPERPKSIKISSSQSGNQLLVELSDTGVGTYHYSEVPLRYFGLRFSQLPRGVHVFDFMSAEFLDSSGDKLEHWSLNSSSASLAVESPRFINSANLSDATLNKFYTEVLQVVNLSPAVKFALIGGSLPPGVKLSDKGVLAGKPTQRGSYAFSVLATGADGIQVKSSFQINVVDLLVQPESAFFWDKDRSGHPTAGDEVRVVFRDPVVIDAKVSQAIVPTPLGENFGVDAKFALDPGNRIVRAILGRNPRLSAPGAAGGIAVIGSVAQGVRDTTGRPVGSATLPLEWYSTSLGRQDWWVGQAIDPLWVGDPSFQVSGLPAGLSCQKGVISGVPTQIGKGQVLLSPPATPDDVTAQFTYSVLPQGSKGLYVSDPIAPLVFQGSVLALDIVAQDPLSRVEAWIGSQRLIPVPVFAGAIPLYWIIPEGTSSGQLLLTQNTGGLFAGPTIQVLPRNFASSGTPDVRRATVIQDPRSGSDYLHLIGSGFLSAEVTAEGIPLTVISQGQGYIFAQFEPATPSGLINIQVANPGSGASFLGGGSQGGGVTVQRGPPDELPLNVPGREAGIQAQKEAFDKLMDEVNAWLGLDGDRAENGKAYFFFVCFHESGAFKHREQICNGGKAGPGTGIPQLEPTSAADAFKRNCDRKKSETAKKCCEALKKAAADLTGDDDAAGAVFEEAEQILDSKKNKWPKDSIMEKLMKKHPSGDFFSLLLARCKENLNANSIPDILSENYLNDIAHHWAKGWWAGAKPGTPKYDSQVSKFERDSKSAQDSLSK